MFTTWTGGSAIPAAASSSARCRLTATTALAPPQGPGGGAARPAALEVAHVLAVRGERRRGSARARDAEAAIAPVGNRKCA